MYVADLHPNLVPRPLLCNQWDDLTGRATTIAVGDADVGTKRRPFGGLRLRLGRIEQCAVQLIQVAPRRDAQPRRAR